MKKFLIALLTINYLLLTSQSFAIDWGGFVEVAAGVKVNDDEKSKRDEFNLAELRLQLKKKYYPENFLADFNPELQFRGDFVADAYYSGKTAFELRDLYFMISPLDFVDLKIGRQVFTWGTGDLLFINDLFPKDYISFLIGRDDEYLKSSSDGVKASFYNEIFDLDLVWIPFFKGNDLPKGDRLTFFDSFAGGIAGLNSDRDIVQPARQLNNSEYALRAYKTFASYETALYFFRGNFKNPRGYKNEKARQLYYPRLDVYGASVRGPFLKGIANAEFGYYNSREDSSGTNRLIENSSFKAMVGYNQDMAKDFSLGLQYLYEETLDYANYLNALTPLDYYWDKYNQTLALRLTKMYKQQTLISSVFSRYSITNSDLMLQPKVTWLKTDDLRFILGANLFWGRDDKSEFGMFEENTNIYLRIRYSF